MKKMIRGVTSVILVGFLTFGTAVSANAGELKVWEHEQFRGHSTANTNCNFDFPDNIYDSGRQNVVSYVTIWNNVLIGDRAIAKIYNNGVGNPSFGAINQADHATCYG